MERRGTIVAVDDDARKLAGFGELQARGRLASPELELVTLAEDLRAPSPTLLGHAPFDAVLLDAPCTGLGNLARHPEIRWRIQPEHLEETAALQRDLLTAALPLVRAGGRLVYAVCSLEPEEGPEVVRMAARHGALLEHEASFTPEDHDTDGFYLAVLRRRDEDPADL
jgi:16S rRNA (cytosine967-C5)-methyltransferase